MRLGVVMMGAGAQAAAALGVLDALRDRGVEPHAVCGMLAGAWPAALYAAGMDGTAMHNALAYGGRTGPHLLIPVHSGRAVLRGQAIFDSRRIERLLLAQSGSLLLSLCPKPAVLLGRRMNTGQHVVFSTRAYQPESGTLVTMQTSLAFAVRAALALAPMIEPVQWMGSPILAETDTAFACRQLLALGAQRVLVIKPQLSPRTKPSLPDLAAAQCMALNEGVLPAQAAVLHVPMDDGLTALSMEKLPACAQCGRRAAESALQEILKQMGMPFCRVLPFRQVRA